MSANPTPGRFGARHRVALLGFFGFFNVYAMRVNLSVAAINMSDELNWCKEKGESCPQEGKILGAFFYGYIVTQVFGGWLASKYGGKWVYGIGILGTSLLTILTPVAAKSGIAGMMAIRVLEGFGEGVTFPAFHAILSQWVPMKERTMISTFVYAGAQIGTVGAQPLSSWLVENYGWPSVFYVFGILGVVWFVCWVALFSSSPATDRWITAEERRYIERNLTSSPANEEKAASTSNSKGEGRKLLLESDHSGPLESATDDELPPVPWRSIFSSTAVWAIIVGHTVANWGFYNLLTCLPQYVHSVLGKSISQLGFISSLPFLCMWFVAVCTGYIADYCRSTLGIRTVVVRKFCQCVGQAISAIAIVAVGHVHSTASTGNRTNHTNGTGLYPDFGPDTALEPTTAAAAVSDSGVTLAIVFLCISVGFAGFPLSGFNVNHLDLAPRYAGVLMGITNTFATIPGFLAPQVTDYLTTANPHTEPDLLKKQWQTVFYIAGGVYTFGIVFYLIFAQGTKQSWADGVPTLKSASKPIN